MFGAIELVASYLKDRAQYVETDKGRSNIDSILYGVPQ